MESAVIRSELPICSASDKVNPSEKVCHCAKRVLDGKGQISINSCCRVLEMYTISVNLRRKN